MGNDDCLAGPAALEEVVARIERNAPVSVALTNFEDYASGARVSRMPRRGIAGHWTGYRGANVSQFQLRKRSHLQNGRRTRARNGRGMAARCTRCFSPPG